MYLIKRVVIFKYNFITELMSDKKFNRRVLREKSLQVLYAYEMNKEGLTVLAEGILSDISNKADKDFSLELINKVIANYDVFYYAKFILCANTSHVTIKNRKFVDE